MENILVLSDIHYKYRYALEVLKAHPECQTVIFLGDGTRFVELLKQEAPEKAYVTVNGNCDSVFDRYPRDTILEISGHRLFICHGDAYKVKGGRGALLNAAKARDCDIALFGHTHIPKEEYDSESGVYMFNPGSIGDTRSGKYTFGILSLDEKNVLFSIGEIDDD